MSFIVAKLQETMNEMVADLYLPAMEARRATILNVYRQSYGESVNMGMILPALRICDNHSTHTADASVSDLIKKTVFVDLLPAHSTFCTQPLDNGFFREFHDARRRLVKKYCKELLVSPSTRTVLNSIG